MRQINGQNSTSTIKQYSSTLLLLGSMLCSSHLYAAASAYNTQRNHAIEQSMIAEFALAAQDPATALHNYTVLAIKSNSTSLKQRALNIALEQNDLKAALDIATHWVVQEPSDVPALFYLAHIALQAHEYELAAESLDKILSHDPSADLERILAGIAPESADDQVILLEALKNSQAKDNPSILVIIAALKAQNGEFEQALDTINQALKKRPKATNFILMKANLLSALGNEQQTRNWYSKASRQHKSNLEIRLAEVKYLIKLNDSQLALDKLEKILKKWPKAEEALFIAGLTSIDLGQYERAERYLVELRHSLEYQNDAYYYLALNAERKQHYETAKAYYRLVDGSLYTVSRQSLINIYTEQQRLNEALRFLTQERVNYPQYASFLYQAQAEILKKMGNKPAAIQLLDEAMQHLSDDPELIYAQVLLLDPFVERDRLDQLLTLLLDLEPNHPAYLNAYAYTLALQNRHLDQARQYAEQALEMEPDQASILDTLGFVAYLQNDFATAAQALQRAYGLSNNPSIGVRYARAVYMQGDLSNFSAILKQLQQKHPNDAALEPLNSLLLPKTIH